MKRNTPERQAALEARAKAQRERAPGFTPMYRRPRGHVGLWRPEGEKTEARRDPSRAR